MKYGIISHDVTGIITNCMEFDRGFFSAIHQSLEGKVLCSKTFGSNLWLIKTLLKPPTHVSSCYKYISGNTVCKVLAVVKSNGLDRAG